MGDRKLGMILRCTGLTLLVLGVLVLLPASAAAVPAAPVVQHGVTIAKSCTQSRNRCADNTFCTQPADICAGTSSCSTTAGNRANFADCLITITDSDGFLDSIQINDATDTYTNGTGVPQSSANILVVSTSGTVTGPGCAVGQDVSPANTCTLAAAASISFQSNFYMVQAADPSPLLDRADVALQDKCDGAGSNCTGGNGCNCGGVTVSFGASTTLQSGCSTPVNLADSTACPDTDNNVCTTAGCEAGVCVQGHIPTVCTPSTNECVTNPACDPVAGCTHPNQPDSTACTDNDNNVCTTAGCEAGVCVQNHIPTVCIPSTNECLTNPACDPVAGCTHPPVGDSTLCTDNDNNVCTTAGCEAGVCVQTHAVQTCTASTNECLTNPACDPVAGCTHPPQPDSTACTDTDNISCTTAGCEAGTCVQTHVDTCTSNEICRTPGFWGTHACPPGTGDINSGCEKAGAQNITQRVLNNFTGLTICGHPITTTDLSNTSAVEAICVAIKGDSSLQVARQLTAAALNCILTNSAGCSPPLNQIDPCAGVSVHDVFAACNNPANLCATTAVVNGVTVDCIEALDCFNNGGTFDPGTDPTNATCSASATSCHDALLSANGCAIFEPPGPAGSPKECNDARKDNCTILCSHACTNASPPPVCIN